MNTQLDVSKIVAYHSQSQIARVLTEKWVNDNMFCPHCGNSFIKQFPNNQPVADFYCPACQNEYELKSMKGLIGQKITDGVYDTMIERITSNHNPDFLFMRYSLTEMQISDLLFVPKYFLLPEIIEKRKPLRPTARRAGWVGCNILVNKIPIQGCIQIIKNGTSISKDDVLEQVALSKKLKTENLQNRGWLFDILTCVNKISNEEFTLKEIYANENKLHLKYPQNKNIRPKIRQQLQSLRDKGFIEFLGNGYYRKVL